MNFMKLIVISSLGVMAGRAYADPAALDPAAPPSATSSDFSEIVVTAQRRAERLEDVPFTVAVESAADLQRINAVDVRALELVVPGLTMQQQDGFLQPALRGVSTTIVEPGSDNPIAIYLDGVYMSSSLSAIVALPDVDHIEVLKGPQGTLFGRNATGGAIQIFTKDPSFTPTGQVNLIGGYYDGGGQSVGAYDLGVNGFVSGPLIPDLVAASVSFSQQRSNGYDRNVVYGAVSPAVDYILGNDHLASNDSQLMRGKLLITPNDDLKILTTAYYTHEVSDYNEVGYVTLGQSSALAFPDHVTPTQPWTSGYDSPKEGETGESYAVSAKVDWTTAVGTVSSTTGYSRTAFDEAVDTDSSYSPDCLRVYACIGVPYGFSSIDLQEELLFTSKKYSGFSFVSGIFAYKGSVFNHTEVDPWSLGAQPLAPEFTTPTLFSYYEETFSKAYGLFTEANYDLTSSLNLTAGIRYSYESRSAEISTPEGSEYVAVRAQLPDGSAGGPLKPIWKPITPRLSARYALDTESNVYVTFSEGFKSGVLPDSSPTAVPASPEKLFAYEVGYKTAQPTFDFNAAAFYYNYRNLQIQSNAGLGGAILIINNAATAKIYGFDIDSTVKLAPGLTFHGGISWLPYADFVDYKNAVGTLPIATAGFAAGSNVIDLSHTRLFKTPKVTLDAGLTYSTVLAGGELAFSPNFYYASQQYYEATHLIHNDNVRVGAQGTFKPARSNFKYALWVKNLTDRHAPISTSVNDNSFTLIPEPPREIGITLTFNF